MRVEIVPLRLVGEVQTRAHEGDAAHAVRGELAAGGNRLDRLVEREVGGQSRIGREPAIAVHRRVRAQLGAWITGTLRRFRDAPIARVRRDDPLPDLDEIDPGLLPARFSRRIDGLAFDELARELEPLVRAWRGKPGDEIVEAAQQELFGHRASPERRHVLLGRARQRGEGRPVEPEIDQGVLVALSQAGPDRRVVPRYPRVPRRLERPGVAALEFLGKTVFVRREDRPARRRTEWYAFVEAAASGWTAAEPGTGGGTARNRQRSPNASAPIAMTAAISSPFRIGAFSHGITLTPG